MRWNEGAEGHFVKCGALVLLAASGLHSCDNSEAIQGSRGIGFFVQRRDGRSIL
jgi:hypothetical protein